MPTPLVTSFFTPQARWAADLPEAKYDVAVRFDFTHQQPPTDVELAEMLRGWAMNVALGYIRGALAEASSAMGLPPLVLDPRYSLDDADVDAIITRARSVA